MLNDQGAFVGFCVDLLNICLQDSNYTATLYIPPDATFGEASSTVNFSGVMGELQRGRADLGVGPITVSAARHRVAQFTVPFLSGGLSLLVRRPAVTRGLFAFLEPFSTVLWVCIGAVVVLITLLTIFYQRLSPYGHYRRAKATNQHLWESMHIVTRSILHARSQGARKYTHAHAHELLDYTAHSLFCFQETFTVPFCSQVKPLALYK